MWLIYTIALLAILGFVLYTSKIVKHQVGLKFKILITCLLELDKNLKVEYETNESIILFTSNNKGNITIYLVENHGVLYVSIESVNIQNYIEKKEWLFIDKMNQYLIFEEITTNFFKEYQSYVFSPKKIKQMIHKSAEKTKSIKIESIFSINNLPQSSFCLAFNSIKILSWNKRISNPSNFEILLFNCVVCYQKIKETNSKFQWQDYINLLIQYLDNQNLAQQIEHLNNYFDHRIILYSEQIELINTNNNPDYNLLYYCFLEKPLNTKMRSKYKQWDKDNFEKLIKDLIKELEDKITQLILLSSQH